jgi:cytochrome c2
MIDKNGKTVSTECTTCHAILAQGEEVIEESAKIDTGQPFVHPPDSEVMEEFTQCTECHSGGGSVYE